MHFTEVASLGKAFIRETIASETLTTRASSLSFTVWNEDQRTFEDVYDVMQQSTLEGCVGLLTVKDVHVRICATGRERSILTWRSWSVLASKEMTLHK